MLERCPEPELMSDEAQARAYAEADFSAPHSDIVRRFQRAFPAPPRTAAVADLGCGPADIALRLARLYPGFTIDAIDGAQAMLDCAEEAVSAAGLSDRIRLLQATLPDPSLPRAHYDIIVSNSLLHHLHRPQTLWETIKAIAKPDACVFIADLRRPKSTEEAAAMVEKYAAGEPEVLRHDFYCSLLAAFTPEELRAQLSAAALELEVEAIDDRHVIIRGVAGG